MSEIRPAFRIRPLLENCHYLGTLKRLALRTGRVRAGRARTPLLLF